MGCGPVGITKVSAASVELAAAIAHGAASDAEKRETVVVSPARRVPCSVSVWPKTAEAFGRMAVIVGGSTFGTTIAPPSSWPLKYAGRPRVSTGSAALVGSELSMSTTVASYETDVRYGVWKPVHRR